jgi:alpha-L-fucosidase
MKQSTILALASVSISLRCVAAAPAPPAPYGATPTANQLVWQKMEYYMFVHFGPNTFTDVEWGDGREKPEVFNPTDLDCRQWASTAKNAGMKGIIITAKHHDGFCLFPSKHSAHTVSQSPWRNGQGDLLRELSDACREAQIGFGVYLSPWDRNHPSYGTPAYNQVFADMLGEALSGYGEVFEQWFDGANGEGESGKKQAYDWPLFNGVVRQHQPRAAIFSDVGPDCRWVGNERGLAGETNWSRLNTAGFGPGKDAPVRDTLNQGNLYGLAWMPAEVDVSIRPGWFYSAKTDDKLKSTAQLMDIYCSSVGRNANLLLNVPPDRRGRINAIDSARLIEFRQAREAAFGLNLLAGAKATASNTRSNTRTANLTDGSWDSYWATDDSVTRATIEITIPKQQLLSALMLQEYITLGQRVARFGVDYWSEADAAWTPLATATTIGYKRILRFTPVTTAKLRIRIEQALACPVICNVEGY